LSALPPIQPGAGAEIVTRWLPGSILIGNEANAPWSSTRSMMAGRRFGIVVCQRSPVISLQVGPQVWQPVSNKGTEIPANSALRMAMLLIVVPPDRIRRGVAGAASPSFRKQRLRGEYCTYRAIGIARSARAAR
jgi:hypothetical protein